MSSLCRDAKNCWGDEAVAAADGTQDLEGVQVVLAKTPKLHDGTVDYGNWRSSPPVSAVPAETMSSNIQIADSQFFN